MWLDPSLTLKWGAYVRPSPKDELDTVNVAMVAKNAGLATTRAAVEKLRGVFGIEDTQAYLEALELERAGVRPSDPVGDQDGADADEKIVEGYEE